jgi:5-formyltetrahydrofolate cyclo-ligase
MKSRLRIIAKKRRKKITLDNKSKKMLIKHTNLCLEKIFLKEKKLKTVGLYYPILNEISPLEFIEYLNAKKIIISLPVVNINKKSMVFKTWSQSEDLQKGHLGTLEPSRLNKIIYPQIIVVPMLMFDRKFNRLGYGGGYYDKLICNLKQYFLKKQKNLITIGLAYSEQETKSIPCESHDEKLDFIITEKELLSKVDNIN